MHDSFHDVQVHDVQEPSTTRRARQGQQGSAKCWECPGLGLLVRMAGQVSSPSGVARGRASGACVGEALSGRKGRPYTKTPEGWRGRQQVSRLRVRWKASRKSARK